MKLSKKSGYNKSRNLNSLIKEKLNNKTFQNKLNAFISKNKYSINNTNTKKLVKQNDFLFKRNINNITINNTINNITNKIEIVSRNRFNENNLKYITSNNSFKSNLINYYFLTSKNSYNNISSIIKGKSNNSSFYFNPSINKIRKKPSFFMNRVNNGHMIASKMNTINKYSNLISNNVSLYNQSINSSINENIKSYKNFDIKRNKFDDSLKNKFYNAPKALAKKKELNKKIQNAILGMNKFSKIDFKFNNKLNQKNNNIIKPNNSLSKNKNKTLANILNKNLKINNCNIHRYNTFYDNKEQNETYSKTMFKYDKNQCNFQIKRNNKQNKNIVEKKDKIEFEEIINKRENDINYDSSLNKTVAFSSNTTKIEEEGMLKIDEVRDIIIYYNLNKESYKDYLFEKFDYNFFIKKKMKKYFKFFMK